MLLNAETWPVFRAAAGFDDATWARGRGWALTFAGGITYYRQTNPARAELGRRAITEVLAEPASSLTRSGKRSPSTIPREKIFSEMISTHVRGRPQFEAALAEPILLS
ncbi:hypothetical protein ACWD6R_25190 [Streptomyces sp. NPDC005151]